MAEDTNIGQRIYDLRVEHEVQQGDLAEAIHLHPSVLNRIEKGTRAARDSEIRAIALYFHVSADELLGLPSMGGEPVLSPLEHHLLEKFRCLDRRGQSCVRHTIENEYDFLRDEQEEQRQEKNCLTPGGSTKEEKHPGPG
jgi:transcriptional regulator with XRE-family HTH domain